MSLYAYQGRSRHCFEAVQKLSEKPLAKRAQGPAKADRVLSQPMLLHNRGIYVFDRQTKDDVLRGRPSSLKSLKKQGP
jgi:predicted nucleic acid-binding Zn ribbon protein